MVEMFADHRFVTYYPVPIFGADGEGKRKCQKYGGSNKSSVAGRSVRLYIPCVKFSCVRVCLFVFSVDGEEKCKLRGLSVISIYTYIASSSYKERPMKGLVAQVTSLGCSRPLQIMSVFSMYFRFFSISSKFFRFFPHVSNFRLFVFPPVSSIVEVSKTTKFEFCRRCSFPLFFAFVFRFFRCYLSPLPPPHCNRKGNYWKQHSVYISPYFQCACAAQEE